LLCSNQIAQKFFNYYILDRKSHVFIDTEKGNTSLEFEPQKRAKFEIKFELISDQNGYELQSLTTNSGQNILNINSALNRSEMSSQLNLNSSIIKTNLMLNLKQKFAKFELQTNSIDHKTYFKQLSDKLDIQSKTNSNNRLLAHLNIDLSKNDNNVFDLEIPYFVSKSSLNLTQKTASFDYKSKLGNRRQVLATFAIDPNSYFGFHSNISWDALKDPNQKLVLDLSARKENSNRNSNQLLIVSAEGSIARNHFQLLAKMNASNLIKGPHNLMIDFIPEENPNLNSLTLNAKHLIENNEIQSDWKFLKANEVKFNAELNVKLNSNGLIDSTQTTVLLPKFCANLEFNRQPKKLNWRINSEKVEHKLEFKILENKIFGQSMLEIASNQSDIQKQYRFGLDYDISQKLISKLNITSPQINSSFLLNREPKSLKWEILSEKVKHKFDLKFSEIIRIQSMLEIKSKRNDNFDIYGFNLNLNSDISQNLTSHLNITIAKFNSSISFNRQPLNLKWKINSERVANNFDLKFSENRSTFSARSILDIVCNEDGVKKSYGYYLDSANIPYIALNASTILQSMSHIIEIT
jgi:ribosomal protein L24E